MLPPTEEVEVSQLGTGEEVEEVVKCPVGPCVVLTHVDKMRSAMLGQTGQARLDLSVHVDEVTLAMPWCPADGESVLMMRSVPVTWRALTTSVKTHARVLTLRVVTMHSARLLHMEWSAPVLRVTREILLLSAFQGGRDKLIAMCVKLFKIVLLS